MKFFTVFLAVLLAACSSSSLKISLGDTPSAAKSKGLVIDNTRYYKTKVYDPFVTIDDSTFTPTPQAVFLSELAKTSSVDTGQPVRLKKLSIYFGYSPSEIQARNAMTVGVAIGGAAGGVLLAAAQRPRTDAVTGDDPDRQSIKCDFLARYKGRIVEFTVTESACDQTRICGHPSFYGKLIIEPPLQEKITSFTHACIAKAVAQISSMKDLPPLADDEQEAR